MQKDNYKKKFIFELRSEFEELKTIFPIINNMILSGCTCTIKVKSSNNEFICSENSYYLEICIFRCKSIFSSLTIRRNLSTVPDEYHEIDNFLKEYTEGYIFFDIDDTYKKVFIYISNSKPKKELLAIPSLALLSKNFESALSERYNLLDSNKLNLLYNLDFFLRKDYFELLHLFPIFNLMIYQGATHFVQLKSRYLENKSVVDFKLKLFYQNQDRPSISVTAKLKNSSNEQQVSIYNFLTLAYSKNMIFNLNYSERHVSLQVYCTSDFLEKANKTIETVFFPN